MFDQGQKEVIEPIRATFVDLVNFVPSMIYALITLGIGILLAISFRWLVTQAGHKILGKRSQSSNLPSMKFNTFNALPELVGLLGFWVVILFFVAASLQTLGIKVLPLMGRQFGEYIPDLIISMGVFFVTYVIVKLTRELIIRGGLLQNLENRDAAISALQLVMWSVGLLIIADQLGIRSTALLIVFAILCTALFGAFALSFGLGAKVIADNLLSIRYAQKTFEVGDTLDIAGQTGVITHIGPTSITLSNEKGSIHIPGAVFSREVVIVVNKS